MNGKAIFDLLRDRQSMKAKTNPGSDHRGFITIFRALAHRNCRLFFSGQSISLVGTWMQQIATSWLVFDLSHSAFLLGIVNFASRVQSARSHANTYERY